MGNHYSVSNDDKGFQQVPAHLIDPAGTFKRVWDVIMFIIIIYIATWVPYMLAFWDEPTAFFSTFDLIIDFMFIMDIIMTFFTPIDRIDGNLDFRMK